MIGWLAVGGELVVLAGLYVAVVRFRPARHQRGKERPPRS